MPLLMIPHDGSAGAPPGGWRHVKVADPEPGRTSPMSSGPCPQGSCRWACPEAHHPRPVIIGVGDTPSIHRLSVPCETVPPAGARRPAPCPERDRGSGSIRHQSTAAGSTGRRAGSLSSPARAATAGFPHRPCTGETLVRAVAAWQARGGAGRRPVIWREGTEDARIRLRSLSPSVQ